MHGFCAIDNGGDVGNEVAWAGEMRQIMERLDAGQRRPLDAWATCGGVMMKHDDGPGGGLIDPVSMLGLATLVVNDHVLKVAARSTPWAVVTGKLSDVAGMVFFPILVVAGVELWQRWRRSYRGPQVRQAMVVAVVVAVFFAAIKVSVDAGNVYAWSLAVLQWPFHAGLAWLSSSSSVPALRPVIHVVDPTDVLTVVGTVYVVWQTRWRARAWRLRLE